MKLLWIGISVNNEIKEDLLRYHAKFLSGAVSEAALLSGFDTLGYTNLDTLNSYRYPVHPQGPRFVERKEWSRNGTSCDINVAYRNGKYTRLLSRKRALCREAACWAKKIPDDEEVTVFIYSMHSPFLAAAKTIKKIHPKTTIALLVLDLPQFMDLHMSPVKKVLKKIDWQSIRRLMKTVDKYILYSRHMADFLKLKDGTWTVMEGSFDPSLLIENTPKEATDKISVMYSGVLDTRMGIPALLDAFSLLGENYELWLTGSGNAVPLIEERAKTDPRIRFFGFLPSRHDLLKKQHEATMLISTRNPEEMASVYCFPSKLFEYMVSGNPVLSTRILGIPEEYFEHLVVLEDLSPATLKEAIERVANMPAAEREAFGRAAADFIIENKNSTAQARHILDFLDL